MSKIVHAYTHEFRPKIERPNELHFEGFELKAGDHALVSKEEKAVNELGLSNCGRLGCVSALAAMVVTSSIKFEIQKLILNFLINTALKTKSMDTDLELEIQGVAMAIASTNTEHPAEMLDYALDLLLCTTPERSDPALCVLIMLIGTQTKHLPVEDARMMRVLEALQPVLISPKTSLKLKRAVARVLPTLLTPLCNSGREDKDALMAQAQRSAVEERDVKIRVGGALLLAAVVKTGTLNTKFQSLLEDLTTIARDKKEVWSRHGAFLCFEALIDALGKTVETHAVQILPVLLVSCIA